MKALLVAMAAVGLVLVLSFVCFNEGYSDDDYLYVLYTDAESNLDLIDVYESHIEDGKPTALAQRYRISDSEGGINPAWKFDKETGIGPFNTFYAAINLLDDCPCYDVDDASEKRLSTSVGGIAYVLDPDDLTRTLKGHSFDLALYNVMLIIPTVYWAPGTVVAEKTEGNLVEGTEYNVLYISSSSSYTPAGHAKVSGMVAYAHSASLTPGKADYRSLVYPYLGIGVYESYATNLNDAVGAGKIVSQSGRVPASNFTVDQFKDLADGLTPAAEQKQRSDYQLWNYNQWTLNKIMSYTVMGSKNSQVMVGYGYTVGNTSCAVSGSTDTVGFVGNASMTQSATGEYYAEWGKTASKLFIESSWGSMNEFVGDAFVAGDSPQTLYLFVGNYLGGQKMIDIRTQPSASQTWPDIYVTGESHRNICGMSTHPATWDTPIFADGNLEAYKDTAFPGDIVNANEGGINSLTVGGRWDNQEFAGVSFVCGGYDIGLANEFRGARLVYLMSEDVF